MPGSFVSYLRVSTDKQGRSGLGIEAQRSAVSSYLAAFGSMPVEEFVEIESGKNGPLLVNAFSGGIICRKLKRRLQT